jgi:hypothetical protein
MSQYLSEMEMSKQSRQIIKTHDTLAAAAIRDKIDQSFAPTDIITGVKDGNKLFFRADIARANLARHLTGPKAEKAGEDSSPQSLSIASRIGIRSSFSFNMRGKWNLHASFSLKSPTFLLGSLCGQVNPSIISKE